ncbi:hypothetical protein FHS42_003316 [Streptomyces zagrosensis]|uniref:Uncharacterized protein n=1 Tax=Streptomyces zagrosensis TaxID=1042984 RepID=A0A7W9UZC1_9ACTN|nr:hypothetical protein [Streptomyces zagrosensis]
MQSAGERAPGPRHAVAQAKTRGTPTWYAQGPGIKTPAAARPGDRVTEGAALGRSLHGMLLTHARQQGAADASASSQPSVDIQHWSEKSHDSTFRNHPGKQRKDQVFLLPDAVEASITVVMVSGPSLFLTQVCLRRRQRCTRPHVWLAITRTSARHAFVRSNAASRAHRRTSPSSAHMPRKYRPRMRRHWGRAPGVSNTGGAQGARLHAQPVTNGALTCGAANRRASQPPAPVCM